MPGKNGIPGRDGKDGIAGRDGEWLAVTMVTSVVVLSSVDGTDFA